MSTKRKQIEMSEKLYNEVKNGFALSVYGCEICEEYEKLIELLHGKQSTTITKELLEKNGFLRYEEYDADSCYLIEGYRLEQLDLIAIDNNKFMIENTFIKIKTVSDLEDALELCGIDKEIHYESNV